MWWIMCFRSTLLLFEAITCHVSELILYNMISTRNLILICQLLYKYLSLQILNFWFTYVVYDYLFINDSTIEHEAISYILFLAMTLNGRKILRFYYWKIKSRFYTFFQNLDILNQVAARGNTLHRVSFYLCGFVT